MNGKIWAVALIMNAVVSYSIGQTKVEGKASYYANMLHGLPMSNGEPYNKYDMTCAHLYYPLGTRLRVKNLRNGKEVVVRVTDRGPHTKRYILDLSRAAAEELDFIQAGFAPVEVTVMSDIRIPYRSPEEQPWTEWSTEHVPISLIYEPYLQEIARRPERMPIKREQPVFRQGELPDSTATATPHEKQQKKRTR